MVLTLGKGQRDSWRWRRITISVLLLLLGATILKVVLVSPLPTDAQMLANLENNLPAFDELAYRYLSAERKGYAAITDWLNSPRALNLKKMIKARDERNHSVDTQWRASIFGGEIEKGAGVVNFSIEGGYKFSLHELNVIYKKYMFIEAGIRVVDGQWSCPAGSGRKCVEKFNYEILPDLDGYPQFKTQRWPRCGVYARVVDQHWLIVYGALC